jgi:hypothetical protein
MLGSASRIPLSSGRGPAKPGRVARLTRAPLALNAKSVSIVFDRVEPLRRRRCDRNPVGARRLALMASYFFDMRSDDVASLDEEGQELENIDAAHEEALRTFAQAICAAVMQSRPDQRFSVEVRDDLGPVLDITGVIASKIHRKQ